MFISVDDIIGKNILSIHLAGKIGQVEDLIINPENLEIAGLVASRMERTNEIILPKNAVREFSKLGLIIDSEDDFIALEDAIKIKRIVELGFSLKSIKVYTESNKYLGYVKDFLLDTNSLSIERLIIHRPFLQSISESDFFISRTQIINITNKRITVEDAAEESTLGEEFMTNFINPFRGQNQPAQNQSPDAKDIV